jgi:hypothetical protein
VGFGVRLGRFVGMNASVLGVAMCGVRVVRGLFVVAFGVVLGRFAMMLGRMFVMFGRLVVVFRRDLGHGCAPEKSVMRFPANERRD